MAAPPLTKLGYNDPSATLEGQLYTDFFFGKPNYGESPATDDIEHATILALDEPVFVQGNGSSREGDYDAITEAYVDHVQIASFAGPALNQFRGNGVRLKGRLWHAHTGHHHTRVLLSMEEPAVSIDDRNAFPDLSVVNSGSGFWLGSAGIIVTAAHVVEDARAISVTRGLYRARAELVAVDRKIDLALLKVETGDPLAHVIRRREEKVRPTRTRTPPRLGERVYTFGFPLRDTIPHSLNMTEGLISSELGIERHQFQISAGIQPGSSGGPVFDAYGNLIGIAVSSLEPSQNINFSARASALEQLCRSNALSLPDKESRLEILPTAILAEAALHFCVEIEVWGTPDLDTEP